MSDRLNEAARAVFAAMDEFVSVAEAEFDSNDGRAAGAFCAVGVRCGLSVPVMQAASTRRARARSSLNDAMKHLRKEGGFSDSVRLRVRKQVNEALKAVASAATWHREETS